MLILGCGYVGRRLARHYGGLGRDVLGLVRTAASRASLAADGIAARVWDLSQDVLPNLALQGGELFHLVPPPSRGLEDGHTRRLVSAFKCLGHPRRVVYVGTTGVYGDCSGAWVDETRPPAPAADRAVRRWDAEQVLRGWSAETGGELVVLRVAGIYGPGRLPLERIRRGLPLLREEESPYSNRIHVDDLVAACVGAMERGEPGAVYNVCDGNPTTMTDYFLRVAEAAGLPRPPLLSMEEAAGELSEGMLSYLRESRRLSNRRMRAELGVTLRYPDLATGVADSL
jgi:nucleoside-diphosphate-sugar epimerase